MPDARNLARYAAAQATAAMVDLFNVMEEDDPVEPGPDTLQEDTVLQMLDAAKLAIEVRGDVDDELGQAYAAICRALEGWA